MLKCDECCRSSNKQNSTGKLVWIYLIKVVAEGLVASAGPHFVQDLHISERNLLSRTPQKAKVLSLNLLLQIPPRRTAIFLLTARHSFWGAYLQYRGAYTDLIYGRNRPTYRGSYMRRANTRKGLYQGSHRNTDTKFNGFNQRSKLVKKI